ASTSAQRLIARIAASRYFHLEALEQSYEQALQHVESDKADLVLEIPRDFERNLVRENRDKVFVAVNAINGQKAGLGAAYLAAVLSEHNTDIAVAPRVEVSPNNWYNPNMRYHLFMVPGILAVLVTMIGGYLTSLNIVKEKEVGTIEQINVSPIRKHHFI